MRISRHWLIIAGMAVLMSRVGFYLLGIFNPMYDLSKWRGVTMIAWSSVVSIATWTVIWAVARRKEGWRPWAVLGLVSPLIGSFLFLPFTPMVLVVIVEHPVIVFTVGLTTGLMAAMITILGRRRGWFGDADFKSHPK